MKVRVVKDDKGEPWWVAKDVCDVLGLEAKHAADRLDDDEKTYVGRTDLGLQPGRTMHIVNESGLYSLILQSRKPEAKAFKRWITHEVLPTIRRHGIYATPQTVEDLLNNPDLAIQVFTRLKKVQEEFVKVKDAPTI